MDSIFHLVKRFTVLIFLCIEVESANIYILRAEIPGLARTILKILENNFDLKKNLDFFIFCLPMFPPGYPISMGFPFGPAV